jgi:steroid delta-isomerase-like uncharacterized protein
MAQHTSAQQHSIDLVSTYYAAFNRGDWTGMLACLSEQVVHDPNQGGREAFTAFLQRMEASCREQLHEVVVMASADGTRAAAEYVVHGEYHHTDEGLPPARGQRYVLPGGAFFEVSEGAISRVSNYYNLQDWIAQVGG